MRFRCPARPGSVRSTRCRPRPFLWRRRRHRRRRARIHPRVQLDDACQRGPCVPHGVGDPARLQHPATLVSGDLEVRASVELSYRALDERERRGFRLLGLLGLPDFAPWLLAPVVDGSVAEAERMVDRLADAQLLDLAGVDATGQVRYRLHDLVRLFARERAEAEDADGERTEAVRQVLGQLLALVDTASAREPSGIISLRTTLADPGRVDRQLAEVLLRSPRAWFNAERAALVAAVELARGSGPGRSRVRPGNGMRVVVVSSPQPLRGVGADAPRRAGRHPAHGQPPRPGRDAGRARPALPRARPFRRRRRVPAAGARPVPAARRSTRRGRGARRSWHGPPGAGPLRRGAAAPRGGARHLPRAPRRCRDRDRPGHQGITHLPTAAARTFGSGRQGNDPPATIGCRRGHPTTHCPG